MDFFDRFELIGDLNVQVAFGEGQGNDAALLCMLIFDVQLLLLIILYHSGDEDMCELPMLHKQSFMDLLNNLANLHDLSMLLTTLFTRFLFTNGFICQHFIHPCHIHVPMHLDTPFENILNILFGCESFNKCNFCGYLLVSSLQGINIQIPYN